MLIKFIEFDQSLNVKGQKPGQSSMSNVEATIARDGIAIPFTAPAKGETPAEECETLIPWQRIKQVVRSREGAGAKK